MEVIMRFRAAKREGKESGGLERIEE